MKLVEKLLEDHYSEKTAEIWKSRFSNSAHRMVIAYVKCGLGRRDRKRRDTEEDDQELELRVEILFLIQFLIVICVVLYVEFQLLSYFS